MLIRGIEIEPQWVVLALLLVAVALGRGRQFVQDWAPFVVLFLAYEAMRGFAGKTGLAPHDLEPWERASFGGVFPTVELQHDFYRPGVIGVQDWLAMGFYFLHFALPITVGFLFWVNSRDHYWRYIAALLLMCALAFVTYLFWPSAPPWYQDHSVHKVIDETLRKWGVSYFISPVYKNLNPNYFAAFPSLHAAFPALGVMFAWTRYRLAAVVLVFWTAAVWTSIVYLGEHYFIDALAGLAYAIVAAVAVWLLARRLSPTPARPSS